MKLSKNHDLSIMVRSEHNYLGIAFDIVLLLLRIFVIWRTSDFYCTKQHNQSYFYENSSINPANF